MTKLVHAKNLKNRTNRTWDMAKLVQIGEKFDLWPVATREQEFLEIWHLGHFEFFNWLKNHVKYKKI